MVGILQATRTLTRLTLSQRLLPCPHRSLKCPTTCSPGRRPSHPLATLPLPTTATGIPTNRPLVPWCTSSAMPLGCAGG